MNLPKQYRPAFRHSMIGSVARVTPQGCGFIDGIRCAAEGAILLAGPCDPLGFPEDLPICIPAAATYVSSCADCLKSAVKTPICAAVSLAEKAGIPVPPVLTSLCS